MEKLPTRLNVMASKFNIYTVHLKCSGSIRDPLNEHKTSEKKCVEISKSQNIKNNINL